MRGIVTRPIVSEGKICERDQERDRGQMREVLWAIMKNLGSTQREMGA